VKKAVDQGLIGSRRYHSYIGMFEEAKGKVKHA